MSTDKPEYTEPAPKPRPPTVTQALSHLTYLGYVNAEGFSEWASTNPGGVCQLIRALVARLPENDRRYFHIYDSLTTPPPSAVPEVASYDEDYLYENEMMAACMDECRAMLIMRGIIDSSVPPMFVGEAVISAFNKARNHEGNGDG